MLPVHISSYEILIIKNFYDFYNVSRANKLYKAAHYILSHVIQYLLGAHVLKTILIFSIFHQHSIKQMANEAIDNNTAHFWPTFGSKEHARCSLERQPRFCSERNCLSGLCFSGNSI